MYSETKIKNFTTKRHEISRKEEEEFTTEFHGEKNTEEHGGRRERKEKNLTQRTQRFTEDAEEEIRGKKEK